MSTEAQPSADHSSHWAGMGFGGFLCSLCSLLLRRPKPIPFVLVVDFFFLLWTAGGGGGGVGVFQSVVGKWACVCACGSGLVLVVGFFFFFLLWTAGSGGGGGCAYG